MAYVSLGSNLGDRAGNLLLGVRGLLEANFFLHSLSSIYETEAVEVAPQPKYLNLVAELQISGFSPRQMLARMLRIEYLLGRRRVSPGAPRSIDLDLLLFGDQIIESEFLNLPHPRMLKRKFVLVPLNEIAPELIHPTAKMSIHEILLNFHDDATVERYSVTENLANAVR
jgi:2-amino-4-hydroxy-6-hydroxymethyldihydropteridine diphosphokinase